MADSRNELEETLVEALASLEEAGIGYALIGGLAVSAHTEGRATKDVDVVLACPNSAVPGFVDALGRHGFSVDPARHIREVTRDGISVFRRHAGRLDVLKPPLPFFQRLVDSALSYEILGKKAKVARPEYLLVLKTLADRERDKADIVDLLKMNLNLDRGLVLTELAGFLSESEPRYVSLQAALSSPPR